jgi:SAM-dependent methyltransferase
MEENDDRIEHFIDNEMNKPFQDFVNYFFKKNKDGLMVDMGCGNSKLHPRFVGVDPYAESNNIDIKAPMWDTPFEDNSVDFLVCFAALEHISKFHVLPTLNEFSRIIKHGASFAILVPNLEWALMSWLNKQNVGWEMDLIFGSQVHDGEYHKTGFSVDIIQLYFSEIPYLEILNIYDVNAYTQLNYGIIGKKRDKIE